MTRQTPPGTHSTPSSQGDIQRNHLLLAMRNILKAENRLEMLQILKEHPSERSGLHALLLESREYSQVSNDTRKQLALGVVSKNAEELMETPVDNFKVSQQEFNDYIAMHRNQHHLPERECAYFYRKYKNGTHSLPEMRTMLLEVEARHLQHENDGKIFTIQQFQKELKEQLGGKGLHSFDARPFHDRHIFEGFPLKTLVEEIREKRQSNYSIIR